jgi:hypothetical protein
VEAEAALVGPDRTVEFDAEAAVHLDVALVVLPRDAEHELTFRFHEAFQDPAVLVFLVLLDHRLQGLQDLTNGLQEFRLSGVPLLYDMEDFFNVAHGVLLKMVGVIR